jgi:hypothetical protein
MHSRSRDYSGGSPVDHPTSCRPERSEGPALENGDLAGPSIDSLTQDGTCIRHDYMVVAELRRDGMRAIIGANRPA